VLELPVRKLEVGTVVEIIVLFAIAFELFALYNYTKLDNRIDEHILKNTKNLTKNDVMIQIVNENMSKVEEHMQKLGEHINRYDEHVVRLNEHINRFEDLIMKSYYENIENRSSTKESTDKEMKQ